MSACLPTASDLLALERGSIRRFIEDHAHLLTGRVLDYGAGKQPYRGIVEAAGGEYVPFDRVAFPANVSGEDLGPERWWRDVDAILCTQILQYVPLYGAPYDDDGNRTAPLIGLLDTFHTHLSLSNRHGFLILTGGTCWREIESADHSRLTVVGARALLEQAGFTVEHCASRAQIDFPGGFSMSLGWAAVAHA